MIARERLGGRRPGECQKASKRRSGARSKTLRRPREIPGYRRVLYAEEQRRWRLVAADETGGALGVGVIGGILWINRGLSSVMTALGTAILYLG